jgi:GH25 family lysozyme M1 (1,4-beta-N-acetylmuramidase)
MNVVDQYEQETCPAPTRKISKTLGIMAAAALGLTVGAGDTFGRPLGIDVSRYQGTINWTSVKGAGITFSWAQATRGLTSPNANFVPNMNNGKAAGVYMGAYHYAQCGSDTPQSEANYFWNLAGPYIKAEGKTLMPMLDMEDWTGHVGATSYTDWANQWCDAIVAKAAAAGVVVKPVIYTSSCNYCPFNSNLSQWGCWAANYNGQSPQTGTPWDVCSSCNPWGGTYWNFWQYTSSGSVAGITGNVDRDVFNGTATELAATWLATATSGGGGVIVDNSNAGFSASANWQTGTASTDKYGTNYRFRDTQSISEPATWSASLSAGNKTVSAWWPEGGNRSQTAPYIIYHSSGSTTVNVNQQINGGQWNSLGLFNFAAGNNEVKLSCWTTTGFVVMADAIKWQ